MERFVNRLQIKIAKALGMEPRLSVKIQAETSLGVDLGYDVIEDKIFLSPEFYNQAQKILSAKGNPTAEQLVRLKQQLGHEIVHSLSYRKVALRADGGKVVELGFLYQEAGSDGEPEYQLGYYFNELVTNFYTFKALLAKTHSRKQRNILKYSLSISQGFRCLAGLEDRVGKEVLRSAFFFGQLEELGLKAEAKIPQAQELFQLLDQEEFGLAQILLEEGLV